MAINLLELRVKLDQMTERIISGLKDRSRYQLNQGIFTKEFCEGKTWFYYRLFKEQNLDSEFGRYEFEDQRPLFFSKDQLAKSQQKRTTTQELIPVDVDRSLEVIDLYRKILEKVCQPGEQPDKYGEVTKLDVDNVLTLYERICGLGPEVAESKRGACLSIDSSPEAIRKNLINPQREEQVISKFIEIAKKYELPNAEEVALELAKTIIKITTDVEVEYLLKVRKK